MWPNGEVLCCDRKIYIATELAKVGGIFVITEDFYVATKFAHDRAGHATTRAHGKDVHMTEARARCSVTTM